MDQFLLGIFVSTLVSIAIALWSEYLIRLIDMLSGNEVLRTQIAVFGGGVAIVIFLYILWSWIRKKPAEI
jgi:hypothetical protein